MQVRDAVVNSEGRGPLNGVSTGALDLTIGDLILLKELLSAFVACSARAVVPPLERDRHGFLADPFVDGVTHRNDLPVFIQADVFVADRIAVF